MTETDGMPLQCHYYNENIDFSKLATEHEEFGKLYTSCGGHLQWQDPDTLQLLTKALLKRDFSLDIQLPENRLCPPVPVRWNYIRWLQEIVDTTNAHYSDTYDPERIVTGLDIGTGASCIYALLACASRPQWRMLGTDVDDHSFEYANKNVTDNGLSGRIKLRQTQSEEPLIPLDSTDAKIIDFVVCNPPFYDSEADMNSAYKNKALPPSAVCTGSINEMICPGGDIGFASRILRESLRLRERVQWYSCMFSRLASAQDFIAKLKKEGITNFAATNLRAGQKTVRWAIAWSFTGFRPRNDVVRHGSLIVALLPPATQRTIEVRDMSADVLSNKLNDILTDLDLEWRYKPNDSGGIAIASANVWSRRAKRNKKKLQDRSSAVLAPDLSQDSGQPIVLAVDFTCVESAVELRWLYGRNTVLLESFIGMLRNELGARSHNN